MYNKSSDLRAMFIETLNRVTQGYTMHTPLKMIPSITLKEKVRKTETQQKEKVRKRKKEIYIFFLKVGPNRSFILIK